MSKSIQDGVKVKWTLRKVRRFQKAIKENQSIENDTFKFDGNAYYTPYAVYLAKYLEQELQPKQNKE